VFPHPFKFLTYPATYLEIGDSLPLKRYARTIDRKNLAFWSKPMHQNGKKMIFVEVHMKKIAVLCAVLVVFLSACGASISLNSDAKNVSRTAASIADIVLPAGYNADFSVNLLGYNAAAFHPGDGHSHLYLVQSENKSDGEKLAEMMGRLIPGASNQKTRMAVIETRPVIVRGQLETLVISDGVNSAGETYRQAMVQFQGKGGPALLVFSEPHSRWNQATVDALIASIN
jgi:hypothetical protein